MKCQVCGQTTDWIGDESSWSAVIEETNAIMKLYECDVCGHQQYTR